MESHARARVRYSRVRSLVVAPFVRKADARDPPLVAWKIALAIAAATPTWLISPTPSTPAGLMPTTQPTCVAIQLLVGSPS
jgi:hypothetical protein